MTFFQPHKGDTLPDTLMSFMVFPTEDDCRKWMDKNLEDPETWTVEKYKNTDIEDAVLLNGNGEFLYEMVDDARFSPLAQEVIKRKVDEIHNGEGKLPVELIPSLDILHTAVKNYVLRNQGKKGFICLEDNNPDGIARDTINCFVWLGGEYGNKEFKIHGIRVVNDNIQIIYDNDATPYDTKITYTPQDFCSPEADWKFLNDGEVLYHQALIDIAQSIHNFVEPAKADANRSLSHATMRPQDLIPVFMEKLYKLNINRWMDLVCENHDLCLALKAFDDKNPWFESEEASRLLNEDIFDALNECTPEGCYFGSHPGDASDYGFWPDQENID